MSDGSEKFNRDHKERRRCGNCGSLTTHFRRGKSVLECMACGNQVRE